MLLLPPSHWVVDADLGRIEVDHSPRHRPVENLPERLRCLESVAGREIHPPGGDLLRGQLTNLPITEHRGRLAEQIAELLDRHRLHVMLSQIRLDELRQRQPARDPALAPHPLELAIERIARVLLAREPATLHSLRVSATGPVAERPQPLTIACRTS